VTQRAAGGSLDLRAPRFVSDLHLAEAQPRTVERFLKLVQDCRGGELVILGDLFEYWAGDDEVGHGIGAVVASALRAAQARGTRIFLMQGNRDMLLGNDFASAAGATLLPDPCRTVVDGAPTLLSHGDIYCTRDRAYMVFRKITRMKAVQRLFLSLSPPRRRALMGQVRRRSEAGKRMLAEDIMDVTPSAIDQALRDTGAQRMIHGHTHRPGFHRFELDGRGVERWVLPDWDFDGPQARGGHLRVTAGRPEIVPA
jgi:UDP-2,3-diacylglucosamine hydrolase